MIIPKGMQVRFHGTNVGDIESYVYALSEDVTISLHSQFSPLVDGGSPKFFKMLAGVTQELFGVSFSGEYKQLGAVIWDSTDPISISFSVDLVMRTNAYKDVMLPMEALILLPVPEDKAGIQGLVPPGPSILAVLGKTDSQGQYAQRLNVQLGGVVLLNCVLTSAEPTMCRYSAKDATDDDEYPIYAKIQCAVQSTTIATKTTVRQLFSAHVTD